MSLSRISVAIMLLACSAYADNSATPPRLPGRVDIQQKLNTQIPLDLMFRDESGKVIRLRDELRGKPVLLNFMYYRCPMLCSMVMEGIASTLTELKFDVGKEFDVITVSFDPRDMPDQAAAKKEKYIKRYGRFSAVSGWHFLTGHDTSIQKLTDAVGFHYAYDPKLDQFAHGTALLVLTPEGRISRYLYGFEYKARDVRLALVEASRNRIGSATDQLLLLCYHYDPATGKYSRSAMNVVRAGGIATIVGLAGFIVVMLRRERRGPSPGASRHPLPASRGEGTREAQATREPSPRPGASRHPLPASRGEGTREAQATREGAPERSEGADEGPPC